MFSVDLVAGIADAAVTSEECLLPEQLLVPASIFGELQ